MNHLVPSMRDDYGASARSVIFCHTGQPIPT